MPTIPSQSGISHLLQDIFGRYNSAMHPRPQLAIIALFSALLWLLLTVAPAAAQPIQSAVAPISSGEESKRPIPQSPLTQGANPSPSPILKASPASLIFLSSVALLVAGFTALSLAQRRADDQHRRPLILGAIGCLLGAILLLLLVSSVGSAGKPIALIPPSPGASQAYCLLISLAALAVLGWSLYSSARRRAGEVGMARRMLPLALGVAGLLSYTNWLTFHPSGFVDRAGMYRSYMLAKYPSELGYDSLYRCTVKALSATRSSAGSFVYPELWDQEVGQPSPASPQMEGINACPERFSPQRWIEFSSDSSFFDGYLGESLLDAAMLEPLPVRSPAWLLVAHALVQGGPPSEPFLGLLALLDPLLLAVALCAAVWAFGLQAVCLAACFLGAFYPAQFRFTGGSLLSLDWLALAVLGLSLLKRSAPGLGGFLLAWSALIKILPAAFLLPLAISISSSCIRAQKIDRAAMRAVVGVLLACALILPLCRSDRGDERVSFPNFLSRRAEALADPGGANISLSTLLSFRPKDLIPKRVKLPISEFVPLPPAPAVRPEAPLALVGFLSLLFFGLWCWCLAAERRVWVLSIFGFALVPLLGPATAASYSLLLVAAFFVNDDRRIPLLLFLSAALMQLVALASSAPELCYPAMSLVVLYFCSECLLTHRLALRAKADAERENT